MPGPSIPRLRAATAAALAGAFTAVAVAACGGPPAARVQASPEAAVQSPRADAWKGAPVHDPPPLDRPLAAGFLVVDGVYDTELTAPWDVLHHVRFHAPPGIELFTVSPDGAAVTTFEGLRLAVDRSFADAPPIDILVVPSAEGSMDRDLADRRLIDWVRRVGGRARYVVSLCDGAFVLAEAGLLDGRAVTTFPGDYGPFAARFPHLDLRVNVSFVQDGRVLTSAGGARSFDVALHLVERIYGEEVAARVGRGMVLPWPPAPDDGARAIILPES